jgi:hypothetical protein
VASNLLRSLRLFREACVQVTIRAEPEAVSLDLARTALIVIDMQRDFLEPGGFGETLGNDVSLLGAAVAPCKSVLDAAREAGLLVIHTREGHRPIFPMRRRRRSNAAIPQCGSVRPARWAAS